MFKFNLLNLILFILIVIYIIGSYRAAEELLSWFRFEKIVQKETGSKVYRIKFKWLMTIIGVVFSWLAVSAIRRMGKGEKSE